MRIHPLEFDGGRDTIQLRETPGNLSGSGSETHQHFSPADATKENESRWIFEPFLTCANALRRVQNPGFSLVTSGLTVGRDLRERPSAQRFPVVFDTEEVTGSNPVAPTT